MQQTISFETSAQVRQPLDVRATIQRRIKSLNLWLDSKSNFYTLTCGFGKKTPKSLPIQKTFVSLPRQKFFRGTDAAESPRQFLYLQNSVENTAAPCRVCGNVPGGLAKGALTTRSAAFLCQNPFKMATLTINRATLRTLAIREWLSRKNESFSTLCGEEFTNQHVRGAHVGW